MPEYDYSCSNCGVDVGLFHPLVELDNKHPCPSCGDNMKRVPVIVALTHGKTINQTKAEEFYKNRQGVKRNLLEKYGVHDATPLSGRSFDDVVKDIKSRGSFVKDKMQETEAKSSEKTAKEHKEWRAKCAKNRKLPKK